MDILLDTHVFLWLMNGDKTLSEDIKELINQTCKKHALYIAAISIWEIAHAGKKRSNFTKSTYSTLDKRKRLPCLLLKLPL